MRRFRVSSLRGAYLGALAQQFKLPEMIHPLKGMASAPQACWGAQAQQIKLVDAHPSLK